MNQTTLGAPDGAVIFDAAAQALDDADISTSWESEGERLVFGAGVSLGGTLPYYAEIVFTHGPEGLEVERGQCTCGADEMCTHLACATLLARQDLDDMDADSGEVGAAAVRKQAVQPPAPWEKALAPLTEDREEHREPVALLFSLQPPGRGASTGGLSVRPVALGQRGTWIRSRLTWNNRHGFPLTTAQRNALNAIETQHDAASGRYGYYRYGSSAEWVNLAKLPSHAVWSLLDQAREAGIALVADNAAQLPVVVHDEPAGVVFEATEGRGRVKVQPRLDAPGLPDALAGVIAIGRPTVALAYETPVRPGSPPALHLHRTEAPLAEDLVKLLRRKSPLSIPAQDRERFERQHLPRLRRLGPVVSPDGSYTEPEPARPVLVFGVAPLDHGQLAVGTEWEYGQERFPADGDARAVVRQPAAEAEITGRAAETLSAWGVPDRGDGRPALAPRVLRGGAVVRFLGEALPRLGALDGVRVEAAPETPEYALNPEPAVVSLHADGGDGRDWFDLEVRVSVGGREVPFRDLFLALALEDPVLVLDDGTYVPLEGAEFARLRGLIEEARKLNDRPVDRLRISRYQVDLWDEFVALGLEARQSARWRETVEGLSSSAALEPLPPPRQLTAELRAYQKLGYSWLRFLLGQGLGGILADDMGLGKTLQVLAAIAATVEERLDAPPFLVVAPSSVIRNWILECARFTPGVKAVEISETAARRGAGLAESIAGAQIVVTTYTLFRLEFDQYQALDWSALILDEAQAVKNHRSAGYRCARELSAPVKVAITGTPLENNLLELWALASLCCPGLLGGEKHFTEFFRQPIEREGDSERLAVLQRRLRPFMLRRTKELVATELPPKQVVTTAVELGAEHRRRYRTQLDRERQKVLGLLDDVDGNRFQIFRSLALLRQLSIDVSLVDDGESHPPSAKLQAALEILEEAVREGHRVLVFSQFTRFLVKVRDAAERRGLRSAYLDGSTRRRGDVVEEFRTGEAGIFFISLKAGGIGLNLVEADYCLLLDPWWNPAVEQQAIDRAHRIGQTRPVLVYRLVSADTIEEKVVALAESKAKLFADVLGGDAIAGSAALSAEDIRGLLG